jgi:haloalkane dehalogenase
MGIPATWIFNSQEEIPGARGQNHVTIKNATRYTQNDQGEELAKVVIRFIAANRS